MGWLRKYLAPRSGSSLNGGQQLLAQLDFGKLPDLSDFPTCSVLQIFIAANYDCGADHDDPGQGAVRVFWQKDVTAPGRLHEDIGQDDDPDCTPSEPTCSHAGSTVRFTSGIAAEG